MRMYFVDGVVFVYGGGQQKLQEGVALCGGRVPKERSESQRTYNYRPLIASQTYLYALTVGRRRLVCA